MWDDHDATSLTHRSTGVYILEAWHVECLSAKMSTKEKLESNEQPFILNDQPTTPEIGRDQGTPETSEYVDQYGNFIERPPAEQRRLMRRIDWHLVPWVSVLHWLAALDSGNLGKARLFGLEADLHMVGTDYNIAVLMLSVTHVIFQIPSNLVLKNVKPSIWLPCMLYFL